MLKIWPVHSKQLVLDRVLSQFYFSLFPIEILQCSAVCENDVFNKYIVPYGDISEGASKINGLKKHKNLLELNGSVLHDAFKTPKEGKKDNYFSETNTSLYFFYWKI